MNDPNSSQNENPVISSVNPPTRILGEYGILFLLWGWSGVLKFLLDYIKDYAYISIILRQIVIILGYLVLVGCLAGTLFFLYRQRKAELSYFGFVLRFVWFSLFLSLVIVNVIQMNVLHEINFKLQHAVFMVFIAFATVVSGGILKQKMLIIGGIIYAICGLLSSYLKLHEQLVLEAVGWVVAFVIPGHLMYANRKK